MGAEATRYVFDDPALDPRPPTPSPCPRTVFFGTPEFAATVLARLLAADAPVEIVAVVTQPDKPVGRSRELTPPPVKALAVRHGIPVLQPVTLRRPAAVVAIERFSPNLGVVAAYGKILPPSILRVPPHGQLNVHASLLPRWRGAWPVGAAILAGDEVTGVSIMRLDEGMDTGPVLAQRAEPILPADTTGSLEARLARLGADLLVATIPGSIAGEIVPRPQDDAAATYCHVVRKENGAIDWTRPTVELERHVRAMQAWPVASTTWQGKRLNVLKASDETMMPPETSRPGDVILAGKRPAVVTGDGLLVLEQVQLEGRNPVSGASFVNGYRSFVGSNLG
ncbi:MAG: methionyl-tRNA formyltransferase [Chloroflexi bacterium]|nr:methionyl-tRNA formyltransferase [Chloroflexota bacterium]